jgi:hypothetical protein
MECLLPGVNEHPTPFTHLEDSMTTPDRSFALPTPGDLRSCTHWSCLNRRPATGPDPAALMQLLESVVDTVAATMVMDAEVSKAPKTWDAYEDQFLQAYWPRVDFLAAPPHPKRLLAEAEFRGLLCLELLHTRTLPRLMASERPLLVNRRIRMRVPDGRGGQIIFTHTLARVGLDEQTGLIRAYTWRINEYQKRDWTAPLRWQQTGIGLQYLAKRYPGHRLASVQAYLLADVLMETPCTPEDLRRVDLTLRAQGLLLRDRERNPLGPPPVTASQN